MHRKVHKQFSFPNTTLIAIISLQLMCLSCFIFRKKSWGTSSKRTMSFRCYSLSQEQSFMSCNSDVLNGCQNCAGALCIGDPRVYWEQATRKRSIKGLTIVTCKNVRMSHIVLISVHRATVSKTEMDTGNCYSLWPMIR